MTPKRRPHISKEKIAQASWTLLASQGINHFTMRGLAKELNVQLPTIYWYFENKQHLYQALANEVARDIMIELPHEGDWKDLLLTSLRTIRGKLKQFPCSAHLFMKSIPESDFFNLINSLKCMLDATPLLEEQKFIYTYHFFNFIVNYTVDEYERPIHGKSTEEQDQTQAADTPFSAQSIIEGKVSLDSDDVLNQGIELLIIGIEQKVLNA